MAWAAWGWVGGGLLNGPLGVPERPMCEPEGGPLLLPPPRAFAVVAPWHKIKSKNKT